MSEIGEGNLTLYLKAEFLHTLHGIFLTQRGYNQQTLKTFNLQESQPTSTPMVEQLKLKTDINEEFVDPTLYRSMMGKLINLTQAMKRIFRYVSGAWDYVIMFKKGDQSMLIGYVSLEYARDAKSGRLTNFFCISIGQ